MISQAGIEDLKEILVLQRMAYISEAEIYSDFGIPPLRQTLEDLMEEARHSLILKAAENDRIIGSVRACESQGTCFIGRLMVHPDYQNRGLGGKLITAIENAFPDCRYELFTGHLSVKNLALYESLGYRRYRTEKIHDRLEMVFMEKK